jgi:hypothetical protein
MNDREPIRSEFNHSIVQDFHWGKIVSVTGLDCSHPRIQKGTDS